MVLFFYEVLTNDIREYVSFATKPTHITDLIFLLKDPLALTMPKTDLEFFHQIWTYLET